MHIDTDGKAHLGNFRPRNFIFTFFGNRSLTNNRMYLNDMYIGHALFYFYLSTYDIFSLIRKLFNI